MVTPASLAAFTDLIVAVAGVVRGAVGQDHEGLAVAGLLCQSLDRLQGCFVELYGRRGRFDGDDLPDELGLRRSRVRHQREIIGEGVGHEATLADALIGEGHHSIAHLGQCGAPVVRQ